MPDDAGVEVPARPGTTARPAPGALLVRLPNWVGDACMALPALRALEAAGFAPVLAGRGWAADLFAGHGWPVIRLPAGMPAQVAALREAGPRHGLLLTNSLSSAAAFRLAGVRALGHRNECRGPLLGRSIAKPVAGHEVETFWRLAAETARWLGAPTPPAAPPPRLGLALAARHEAEADGALRAAGLADGDPFVVLAPLAAGTVRGRPKAWPGFAALDRRLAGAGVTAICCPGPGESQAARDAVPSARSLDGVGLGAYAALCRRARITVANDSGPMHLAAAVDAPVLGVFGPSEPARTRPWSPDARYVGGDGRWPAEQEVAETILAAAGPSGWAVSASGAARPAVRG